MSGSAEASRRRIIAGDLGKVLSDSQGIWPSFRGARIFMTGGTGFIGCWLLESLRHADQELGLGLKATMLTRDPEAFARKAPHLAHYSAFSFIAGDVTRFASPDGAFSHLVHAATDASAPANLSDLRRMFDTIVAGTRRALDFAVEKQVERVLFLSTGAVYGQQPWDMERVAETWQGAPDCTQPRNSYAEAKRAAEMLCAIYAQQFGLTITTARIFALLGPYLSLDIHFAAGNFIRDAMDGKPVIVNGDGRAVRSYLYAGDLAVWLLTMLARAEPGKAYNVGSEEGVSIGELARATANVLGEGAFEIRGATDSGWNPGRYVPDTTLARQELGLYNTVPLVEAIRRTALWNGWTK